MTPEERKAHPRYEEYWDARRSWRDVNFSFLFGGYVESRPTFPTFEEWLENHGS